ncbi:hypothetical protein AMD27_16650 (plasmid) [Acinetobacter sp. TGL-Y2]|uniref:hypothetical protein n=1 Tax=Acinetobacter sp. TGL-Y2 TaxID=1407071 RepID=UPI0007A66AB7|nr:hypothetical protein [Acinetobacter sp. TGL-Y2]AMW80546.1 hypothetical protein AMD27_16650 [Acinetobacter sp. TGL-Y2]
MASDGKKEFKLTIHDDRDPELYKWAASLRYGTFPKLVIEMLRWYEVKGLLVKGGVASPDLVINPIDVSKIQDSNNENQILEKLEAIESMLRNGLIVNKKQDELSDSQEPQTPTQTINEVKSEVPDVETVVNHASDLSNNESESNEMNAVQANPAFRVFKRERNKENI